MRQSFLNFIQCQFGKHICTKLKKYMKLVYLKVNLSIKIRFLKCCRRNGLIPCHLRHPFKNNILFRNVNSSHKLSKINNKFVNNIIRLELEDTYISINKARAEVNNIAYDLSLYLPFNITQQFFAGQDKRCQRLWLSKMKSMESKIEWMISERRVDIRPILFDCVCQNPASDTIVNSEADSKNGLTTNYEINISPHNFNSQYSLNDFQDKWFINLSGISIPKQVQLLLQLGDRFNLPLTNSTPTTFEFIKNVERNIAGYSEEFRFSVQNDAIHFITKIDKTIARRNDNDRFLISCLKRTKEFIKEQPNVLFTRADKGNTTVVLNKNDYISKMEDLLGDKNTYEIVKKDHTKKLTNDLHSLLSRWKNRNYITEQTYKWLNTTDGVLPRAYGLPKIHKPNNPLRIIVSSVNSPLYNIACFIHEILNESLKKLPSYIKNSFELVSKLKGLQFENDITLASLDVVSLFTNIPITEVINSITKRWDQVELNTIIPLNEFLIATNLILNSTYFSFNNVYYKQIFGTPMGSPLSPIVADLVLQDLETTVLESLPYRLPVYYRYVDDILFAAPKTHIIDILNHFNLYHNRLQFTLEVGVKNHINFLNVSISVDGSFLKFDLYHKPTSSERYLSFHSHHPLMHKKGVILSLVDKALILSHPEFHQKNLEWIISVLLKNCYPLEFIFTTIRNRIKFHLYKTNITVNRDLDKRFFTIPYVKDISERFLSLNNNIFKVAFTLTNKLNKFIKTGKDPLSSDDQSNVVYKISCKDCNATYVGQTKRKLKTRINEHRADIKKSSRTPSVITAHRLDYNHEFNWDKVEVLDREPVLHKRLTAEMIHIKRQEEGLNKQSDTESLSNNYLPLICPPS